MPSSDHSKHSPSNSRPPISIKSPHHPRSGPSSSSTIIPIPGSHSPQIDLTPYSDASPPHHLHRIPSQNAQREQDVQAALQFSRARSGTFESVQLRHSSTEDDQDLSGPRRPSVNPGNPPDPRFLHSPPSSHLTPTRLCPAPPSPLYNMSPEPFEGLGRTSSRTSLDSSHGAFIDHRPPTQHPRPSGERSPGYFRSALLQSDPRLGSTIIAPMSNSATLRGGPPSPGVMPMRENASLIDHRHPVGWGHPDPTSHLAVDELKPHDDGRGLAGMLPHFPYPFDFGALESFAKGERDKSSPSTPDTIPSESPPNREEEETGVRRRRIEFVTENQPGRTNQLKNRRLSESAGPLAGRQRKLALFEGGTPEANAAKAADAIKTPLLASRVPAPEGRGTGTGERPYRFSFYSNALPSTIHARSLAEIPAEDQTFEDLFVGRRAPVFEPASAQSSIHMNASGTNNGKPRSGVLMRTDEDAEANTWWLDVLSPTDDEMKLLSKVFGIHPLTTEDIQMEETREKIELFRNYYLVCFRSFDQDPYSPTYLEPLNMYIIVFREGTLSFHFRGTPHPQNVRRRIKQLKDYINVTSDWISYALIDDITDAFGPLIQSIEYEVDSIDELVLILKDAEQSDMLRRIGTCRKKVMGLLRLMGNKADVVKGLAKRCNENWSVAPKSDIGLYLSDIQDHLVTMTQNLNHYEKILSRSHSNYLAQISIEMTDANNQINDVLSKLTALGSILIPMNLVTGLWGMNVHVPGQDVAEGYAWFLSIVCGLVSFGVVGAWLTLRYFKFSKG